MLCPITKNIFYNIIFKVTRHFHTKLNKRSVYNMDKVYFRYNVGENVYHLSFVYTNPDFGVERQFNFSRQSNENVGALLDRVNTNIEKVLGKKKSKKNKKSEESSPEIAKLPLNIKLIQNKEEIHRDVKFVDLLQDGNHTELCILDKSLPILVNAPWIENLNLPSCILAGFPVYPSKFEGMFLDNKLCTFRWFSTTVKDKGHLFHAQWIQVSEGFTYISSNDDIGKFLKIQCIPGTGNLIGPEVEAISTNAVEAGPGFCPFEIRHSFTKEKLQGTSFRVVSYNILADLYSDSDFSRTVLFPYCPKYALDFNYRKQLLIKEILGYNSDIICLQEVDTKVFQLDLIPLFGESFYEGIYCKKRGQVSEGLACFFRQDRFKLLESLSCILGEEVKTPAFSHIWSMISDNEAFVSRLTGRSTVVQAVVLQSVENDEIVVVGNTHLYFHPDADHVRLMQGGLAITWLNNVIENVKAQMPGKRVSLIFCGDFNSVPSCGIYQLYTTGVAPCDIEDWKSNKDEAVGNVTLTQPLPLSSACGTPEYTNYTVEFADCLDYIYHDKTNLDVVQVVPFPSVEELKQNGAIPSVVFPSDHVALIADLKFK